MYCCGLHYLDYLFVSFFLSPLLSSLIPYACIDQQVIQFFILSKANAMNTKTTPFEINKGTILINKIGINGILGRLSYPSS